MLDDEAERDRSLAQGLGVFFRNRLSVLGHSFQTQLCGLFDILERFLIGIAPGMTVRQCRDFRIVPGQRGGCCTPPLEAPPRVLSSASRGLLKPPYHLPNPLLLL